MAHLAAYLPFGLGICLMGGSPLERASWWRQSIFCIFASFSLLFLHFFKICFTFFRHSDINMIPFFFFSFCMYYKFSGVCGPRFLGVLSRSIYHQRWCRSVLSVMFVKQWIFNDPFGYTHFWTCVLASLKSQLDSLQIDVCNVGHEQMPKMENIENVQPCTCKFLYYSEFRNNALALFLVVAWTACCISGIAS